MWIVGAVVFLFPTNNLFRVLFRQGVLANASLPLFCDSTHERLQDSSVRVCPPLCRQRCQKYVIKKMLPNEVPVGK